MKKALIRYNNISNLNVDYQIRIRDLGDFYQQLPFDTTFKVYESTGLDATIDSLDKDTNWVVVVSYGHLTQDRPLYDMMINYGLQQGSPLVGHILNFADQYPHLHPQIFAFDYAVWHNLGRPRWNYSPGHRSFTSVGIEASTETFHDDYTPYWIRGSSDERLFEVTEMQTGAEVIKTFIENGHTVINVPKELRDKKLYLYPEQQWERFNNYLNGGRYFGTVYEQKTYSELVDNLRDQVQKNYYVLNTEPLSRPLADVTINHYMGVASGLKLVATMIKNGYTEDTAITHFDFSDIALEFQQYIYNNWDGDITKYQSICKDFESAHPDAFICQPRGTYDDNFKYLLDQIPCDAETFKTHWQAYQKLKPEYLRLNLFDSVAQKQIQQICQKHIANYLWISNAFWMEYSLVKHGKEALSQFRDSLITQLREGTSLVVLDVEDTWHQGLITINH